MTSEIGKNVQVNIPFTMLQDTYLERFLEEGLNPEIGLDATALDCFSREAFAQISKRLSRRNLRVTLHAPFIDLSPGSPDPEVWRLTRRRYEQVLKLIPLFRPRTVVCHVGFERKRYGYLKEIWYRNSIRMWSWLGDCVSDEGSKLMLENVFEDGPDDLTPVFEKLDSERVGFCLDTGHQSAFGKASLEAWVDRLGPYLGQVHLHDNLGKDDDHMRLGAGVINFSDLFSLLKDRKPPVVTLEPHKEEDLLPSLDYLEKIWPW